ncbi:MAG: hypothetical protein IPJ65_25815 [Archangiaceae bacterium]|nr:hypothetical protein [Archangiaceae bacterium]
MVCAHFLLTAALAANPDLEKATKLVNDLQYAEARAALESAIKRTGNDRDTLLHIYELQGIVYATLNEAGKAGKAFQALLVLDPEHKLSADYPPRVMTPFYESRGRASELGRLELKALPAAIGAGKIGQLAVEISSDPLKMVKKVKFHVRSDGGGWAEQPGDVSGKTASVSVDAARIEWWADAIGEREAVLFQVGNEAQPRVDIAAQPSSAKQGDAPLAAKTEPTPAEPRSAGTEVEASSGGGPSGVRIAGVAVAVVGVAGVVVGSVFGAMANSARQRVNGATTDAQGRVTGITQVEAYELDRSVHTNAAIANTMWIAGGALAAVGVVMIIAGGSSSPSSGSVSLSLTGNGAMVSGSF